MTDFLPCPLCEGRGVLRSVFFARQFVVCEKCGCTAGRSAWANRPRQPAPPPPAQVALDSPVEALTDESLAAVLRSAQALVKASVEALKARGFSVWADTVHDRDMRRDTYFPDTEFSFRIKKSRVVETEKEL